VDDTAETLEAVHGLKTHRDGDWHIAVVDLLKPAPALAGFEDVRRGSRPKMGPSLSIYATTLLQTLGRHSWRSARTPFLTNDRAGRT
jgi:hypothetical protein